MIKPSDIEKGNKYWCYSRSMTMPLEGVVIALTDNVGKQVGVQFDVEVGNGHTCDGRGKDKHCLWFRPNHLYTADGIKSLAAKIKRDNDTIAMMNGKDVDSL